MGTFVSLAFNFLFGGIAAYCLVKLTCNFGGLLITFVQHLVALQ
jgi:hypothetical protein